jgi:hypothetical protein
VTRLAGAIAPVMIQSAGLWVAEVLLLVSCLTRMIPKLIQFDAVKTSLTNPTSALRCLAISSLLSICFSASAKRYERSRAWSSTFVRYVVIR